MDNPFLKRLMKDTKEDVVHSSAYAKEQNREGIGAASVQGFSERMQVDERRSLVKRYGDSRIAVDANRGLPGAKKYEVKQETGGGLRDSSSFNSSGATNGFRGVRPQQASSGSARPVQPPARRNPGISR